MQPYPLQFEPVLKQTIWGGRLLGERLGKPIGSDSNYAESWEVVDHGDDQSVVADGDLKGKTLSALIADDAAWILGTAANSETAFPLLLKYLDCNRVLSVQVHPDDTYGLAMSPPDLGKTEAWYIVDSKPDSLIYAGLKSGIDRVALREAIDSGQTEQVLHSFHPDPGDLVFIPAGTVHALGAGLLVAEIQQSSNTTFRLFDWNRVGADGNARPLHIEPSLDVTDYESGPVAPITSDPLATGWQSMVQCDKFVLRILRSGEAEIGGDGKFHIITVPTGQAILRTDSDSLTLTAGSTVMLPAAMGKCVISAQAESAVMASMLP
ncbi:putative mannose-6-phosphate isomerase YvyI [Rubripirellula obstinata]|uniref:Phosphohexomutase n=1 Tax=Rubripirellula obstinata TaxID=406547 RepID=A0A5B1CI53_9BACT|nr:type I phosphomannose isomerase catalytic subunit [Rubripirellula obstinata]KAA1259369.1 putative mannose-6-phosphate isomerase YvyI [Rubripirellula obstinata]